MADVRPFRGLRYNQPMAGDLSNIVSPPFDTISPQFQSSLHQRSPYNVVRMELGESFPTDTPKDNRYTRTAALFDKWRHEGVLVREEAASYYLVRHSFLFRGRERARTELMAVVRLEPYENRVVLPHEYSRDADKRDRFALMEACHANISPIMCLYRDQARALEGIFMGAMDSPPLLDFTDAGDQGYQMWRIGDPATAGRIRAILDSKPIYIADGHHRYETALTYRETRVGGGAESPGDQASNFVMMGLIDVDDPGLLVLPYHRVLGGLSADDLRRVREGLAALFDGTPVSVDVGGLLQEVEERGREVPVVGLLDPEGDGLQLLGLRQGIDPGQWGLLGGSEAWILEQHVLRPVLGDSLEQCVSYAHEGDEAAELVGSGRYQMGFFLKPFPLDLFQAVVNSGQRLPPKSTFFYPKLATGLAINPLEGEL